MKQSRKNKARLWLAAIAVAACVSACDDSVVYDRYHHTHTQGWDRSDTLAYDVTPLAQSGEYDEVVGLRLDGNYPFIQLFLIVEQTILPSNVVKSDTVMCDITTSNGTPLGDGVNFQQYSVPLECVRLSKGDSLHVTIRHHMRRELLTGITDVGFKLLKKK